MEGGGIYPPAIVGGATLGDRPTCYRGRSYIGRIGPPIIVGGATWRGGGGGGGGGEG